MYFEPRIHGNTGAAIRLAACTGAKLHLIEPLGFSMDDAHLRRAGLDYHDLATTTVHPSFDAALEALPTQRIFAFTSHTDNNFADVSYQEGDILLFGPEPTGLPDHIIAHERITKLVRIPMLPHIRSLNLSNATAIAVYEAWRQHGFAGAGMSDGSRGYYRLKDLQD